MSVCVCADLMGRSSIDQWIFAAGAFHPQRSSRPNVATTISTVDRLGSSWNSGMCVPTLPAFAFQSTAILVLSMGKDR